MINATSLKIPQLCGSVHSLFFFIRFEIIAKRGIIARFNNNTSFRLYEKVEFLTLFNFLAATQKVACYRFLHILAESEQNYFHQNLGEK